MSVVELLPVALLGAILGLDVVSFPQAMISRPLVAATLGGAMAGDVRAGLTVGVLLELLALETLPVGASRYPEWGSAAVVGGALYAGAAPEPSAGVLPIATLAALVTGWVGGWSMYVLRKLNGEWATAHLAELDAGRADAVVQLQLRGLVADMLRAGSLTLISVALWARVLAHAAGRWWLSAESSRIVLAGLALAVAAAAVWKLTHGTPGARWLLLGGALAAALVVVLR